MKWLFISQSLYDKASLCVQRQFIRFKWQLSSHFGASCSFRQQLWISLSEKTSKGLQPESQRARNLLSQEAAGMSRLHRSLLIPPADRVTYRPFWIDTRLYKLEVPTFLYTYGRAAAGSAAVWGQGAVTSYLTAVSFSQPKGSWQRRDSPSMHTG